MFSTNPNPTPENSTYTYYAQTNSPTSSDFTTDIYNPNLSATIPLGTTIYVRAYGDNGYGTSYYDNAIDAYTYPALGGASGVASFTKH